MKKILSKAGWLVVAAAFTMGFTGCSSTEDDVIEKSQQPTGPQTYTMTIQASKGDDGTRALSLSGSTLNATWAKGEAVTVYNETQKVALSGTLTAQSSGASTTLKGSLIGTIAANDELTLKFLSPNYGTQDGTLTGTATSIDKVCDYAEATVHVATVDGNNTITITETSADFQNQQAIVKFTLLDKAGTTSLSPTALTMSNGTNNVALTNIPDATYTSNGAGVLFIAIPGFADKTVTLSATVGTDTYTYEKSDATFTNSQYYEVMVKMSKLFTCSSSDWSANVSAFNNETSPNPILQLTSDINIDRHNFIVTRSDGIIDLNGHSLSALDVRNNEEGKIITIKNGTVSGNGDVAIDGHPDWADFYKGTVILEDLTVNKMIFVDGHKYIINSGTYNEKIFNVTTSGYPGKLVINGGKFLLSIHGEYSGVTYGTYELRGGKYAIRPEDSWCATGYSVKANTDDDSATYPWIVSEGIQSVPELGDLYYSDGTYSSTLVSGKTPIGVIAYIDQSGTADDEITEKSNGGGHGLVLCLKNAASNLVWHTTREWVFSECVSVQNTAALKRYSDVSGYSLTSTLSASANASTAFPAAWQAKNYSELTAPSGSTGWFLPSAQQWVRMMTGLGGLSEDAIVYGSVFDNRNSAIDLWDAAFAKAGSGNYDSMSQSSMYWTSSECDQTNAIRVVVDQSNVTGYGPSLYINGFVKDGNGSGYCRVRPVLAF